MKSNRTNKAWQPPATTQTRTPRLAAPARPKKVNAADQLEQHRAEILAQLDRIRAEVIAYGADVTVPTYGHAGDLGGVLEGLDNLHLVGRAYKLEVGK